MPTDEAPGVSVSPLSVNMPLIYSSVSESNPMSGGIDRCLCVAGLHLTLETVERDMDKVRKVRIIIYYCLNYYNNAASRLPSELYIVLTSVICATFFCRLCFFPLTVEFDYCPGNLINIGLIEIT